MHQIRKFFTSIVAGVDEQRTVAFSPEHIHRKSTKISILLKPIQFKVISYIKSNKSTHKSMEVFIIATLELSLYWMFTKFRKKLQQEVSEDCPFLTASTFSFFCFILRTFLSPTLWTYADRVCAKYWRETKNCMTVD